MKLPLSSAANQMALIFLSKFSVINRRLVDFRSVFRSGTQIQTKMSMYHIQTNRLRGKHISQIIMVVYHSIGKHTWSCSSSITSAGSLRQISNASVSHLEVLDLDLASEHSKQHLLGCKPFMNQSERLSSWNYVLLFTPSIGESRMLAYEEHTVSGFDSWLGEIKALKTTNGFSMETPFAFSHKA
ncbi:Hypothetical_protein [Hexamita inflata]|uniref:Hypothetical_protein n=1 Tax=Hexamita inflata TaxID=28002 RepID=A0AA86NZR5_9EUKA|nr:Hypothetical protein HINF_LOCUS15920 [Hexamita inflata]